MKLLKIILSVAIIAGVALATKNLLSHPGKKLFNDPGFAGSQNQYSCASCHANGDKIGNVADKTSFLIVETQYFSVEDVINKAMITPYLSGEPIDKHSQEMKDLVDYLIQLKAD